MELCDRDDELCRGLGSIISLLWFHTPRENVAELSELDVRI